MKIDRLMAILTILLQQDKVTAPVLSEKLEVSRRTISRDLEALCPGGDPNRYGTGLRRRDFPGPGL